MANILLKSLLKEGADTPYDWKHDKNARWRTNDENPYVNSDRQRKNSAKNAKNVDKIIDIADRLEKDGYECDPWGIESDGRMGLDFTKYLPGGGQIWFALAPDEDGKLKMPLVSYGETVEKAGGIRGWFGGKDNVGRFKSVDGIKIDADNLSAEDLQKTVEDTLRKGIANMQSQWSKQKNLKFPIINSLHKEAESSLKRTSSLPKSKSDTNKPQQPKAEKDPADTNRDAKLQQLAKLQQQKAQQDKQKAATGGASANQQKVAPTQQQPNAQPAQDTSKLKVKNPETGNDISVKAALTYDKNHPVYKAAQQIIARNRK